jgi:hypothetical protein
MTVLAVAEIERTTGIGERPANRRDAAQKLLEGLGFTRSARHRQHEPESRLTLANARDELLVAVRADVAAAEVRRTGFERAPVRAIASGAVAVAASTVEEVQPTPTLDLGVVDPRCGKRHTRKQERQKHPTHQPVRP